MIQPSHVARMGVSWRRAGYSAGKGRCGATMTAEAQSRLYDELLALVAPHGQEHLLAFWHELDGPARQSLAAELRQIDYGLVHGKSVV